MNNSNKNSLNVREIVASVASKTNCTPRLNGENFIMRCPAHEDKKPSLSVTESRDGKILIRCFSGCSVADICHALGIKVSQLFPKKKDRA